MQACWLTYAHYIIHFLKSIGIKEHLFCFVCLDFLETSLFWHALPVRKAPECSTRTCIPERPAIRMAFPALQKQKVRGMQALPQEKPASSASYNNILPWSQSGEKSQLPKNWFLLSEYPKNSFFPLISAHAFCACRVCVKCAQTQISWLKNFIFQSFLLLLFRFFLIFYRSRTVLIVLSVLSVLVRFEYIQNVGSCQEIFLSLFLAFFT